MADDDAPAPKGMTPRRSVRWTIIGAFIAVGAVFSAIAAIEWGQRDRESIAAITALQSEMAIGAASEVRQFITDVETAMRASATSVVAAAEGLNWSFRLELLDLLKVAPTIASASALDLRGMEVARVARDELIDPTDLRDQSTSIAFQRARQGEVYYGRPTLARGSEPVMTIAIPIVWFEGEQSGVLVAELGLHDLSDTLAEFGVTRDATAYVVTDEGALIAHPQSSLMLQALNISDLAHVQAALAGEPIAFEPVDGVEGEQVIAAYAPVGDLPWTVLIERPAVSVLAPISASHLRIALLLALGLALLAALALLLRNRVFRPLAALQAGTARIRSGVFDQPVAIAADDEFREVAATLNDMAARWHRLDATLATQIDSRRKELGDTLLRVARVGDVATALQLDAVLGRTGGGMATIGETIGLLEKALSETPAHERRLLVAIETALSSAYAMAGRPQDALQAYQNAIDGAGGLGTDAALLPPIHAIVSARAWPELLPARLSAGRRGLAISGKQPFEPLTGDLIAWHFLDLIEAGLFTEARALVATTARRAEEKSADDLRLRALHMEIVLAIPASVGTEVEHQIEAAFKQSASAGLADAAILHSIQTFSVLRERGNHDEAKEAVEKLRADVEGSPLWPALIALLISEIESPARARVDFELLATAGFDAIPRDGRWAVTIAILAELSARLEDASRATALHQLLDPFAGHNIVSDGICLGPADRYLGMLAATRADLAGAERYYEGAVALSHSSDQPIWRAHTLLDLARVLIDRHGPGDQARAAELLDEALTAAKSFGLIRLRDGCLALLSQKPNEGPLADGLTPAELRVLRLLASGATNRAIGEKLFLSPHTVANHVRNILAKTNSANRTEAANYAQRHNVAVDDG